MEKCASCALKNYLRKNWMSDCSENFRNYCQYILLMKYIIKNIGHWLNFCVIILCWLDFCIFCMSQRKIIQQILRPTQHSCFALKGNGSVQSATWRTVHANNVFTMATQ
jgi:hypothetical protein